MAKKVKIRLKTIKYDLRRLKTICCLSKNLTQSQPISTMLDNTKLTMCFLKTKAGIYKNTYTSTPNLFKYLILLYLFGVGLGVGLVLVWCRSFFSGVGQPLFGVGVEFCVSCCNYVKKWTHHLILVLVCKFTNTRFLHEISMG